MQTKDTWYILRSALFYTLLFYAIDFLAGIFIDRKSVMPYFANFSWFKFLFNWIAWIGIQYLFVIKGNSSQLKHKKKELQKLKERYASIEDVA